MTLDAIKVAALVLAFAGWVTVHVAIAFGLFARKRWGKGLLAFFVPIAAPYFGVREGMPARAVMWIALVVAYGIARAFAV